MEHVITKWQWQTEELRPKIQGDWRLLGASSEGEEVWRNMYSGEIHRGPLPWNRGLQFPPRGLQWE